MMGSSLQAAVSDRHESIFLNLSADQRWDFAGIDGLQMAKSLFGNDIDRIAPFQSFETPLLTELEDCSCAVLRLCEGNFRVSLQKRSAAFEQAIQRAQAGRQVWVRQCEWMGAIALPESVGLTLLPKIAVAKPPYRLDLQMNCAAPARINGISVLIWRHALVEPAFELHLAIRDLEAIKASLSA